PRPNLPTRSRARFAGAPWSPVMTRLGHVKACKRSGTPLFKWGATTVSEQRRSLDFVTRSPQSPDIHAATCTRSRPKWRSKISTRSAGDDIVDIMALPQWGSVAKSSQSAPPHPLASDRHAGGTECERAAARGASSTKAPTPGLRPRGLGPAVSRNGRYGIFGRDRADHSALMPADLITLRHFSVSSAMSLPKSAGEPASAVPPRSASRAFMLGSARAALTSLLSLSTISVGVFLGAPMPVQKLAS